MDHKRIITITVFLTAFSVVFGGGLFLYEVGAHFGDSYTTKTTFGEEITFMIAIILTFPGVLLSQFTHDVSLATFVSYFVVVQFVFYYLLVLAITFAAKKFKKPRR